MGKRLCRKCGKRIPVKIKIDGKEKNLQNRKFCLECSPWGKHNTSPNDPIARIKGLSYKESSEECKERIKVSLYKRALQRKTRLIKNSGGKCILCGYNKNVRCLSFHHRDKDKKIFGLSLNHLWSKKWNIIKREWKKCDLLCMNCHGEVEDKISRDKESSTVNRVNAKYGTSY
jgi:hypothetical protein